MRCMGEYVINKLFISLLNIYKCACVFELGCRSHGVLSLHPQKIMDAEFYNMMDAFVLIKHEHVFLLKRM